MKTPRKYKVRTDGAVVGSVWRSASNGRWAFQRECALLVGGHRDTRKEAEAACIEAWRSNSE